MGTTLQEDVTALKEMGMAEAYRPDIPTSAMLKFLKKNERKRG